MNLRERAKELASEANECCYRSDGYEKRIEKSILQAFQEVRREAIEEAISVVESMIKPIEPGCDCVIVEGVRYEGCGCFQESRNWTAIEMAKDLKVKLKEGK